MKVLMINSVCGIKSTGRICTDLAEILEQSGHECKIAYGRENVPQKYQKYAIRIGTDWDLKWHGVQTRLFDRHGLGSKRATKKFIKQVKEYDPDIIHLHNLHGYYLNLPVLFKYLRESKKPVVWSLHDCWSLTGHCAHFDFNGCDKWKTECKNCAYTNEYPKSFFDASKRNFKIKQELYMDMPNLSLIVPSKWMCEVLGDSFLHNADLYMFPAGIDLNRFKPTQSDFKKKNDLENKYIVLGVASIWNSMKGIEYMSKLANDLPEDRYQVVIVGNIADGFQLSDRVMCLHNTDSIEELCALYSTADVFVNPTLQETQGLTTIEAFACGTPAVIFGSGGSADCIDNTCGVAIERGNYDEFLHMVIKACEKKPFTKDACIEKSKKYDKNLCYNPILNLYNEVLEKGQK